MKKLLFIVIFILIASTATADPGDIIWANAYTSGASFSSVDMTSSGGSICAGSSGSQVLITKLDYEGNELWSVTYGGSEDDDAEDILSLSDGSFLVCGQTESDSQDLQDAFLWKLDASGGIIWEKNYDGPGYTAFTSVIQNADGNLVCAGYSQSESEGYQGVIAVYTIDGDLVNSKVIGTSMNDLFKKVIQNQDGSYTACGYSDLENVMDYWLVKMDAGFGVEWMKNYHDPVSSRAHSIVSADGGGFLLGGFVGSYGDAVARLIRVDGTGDVIWEKDFGGDFWNTCNDLISLDNGGFVVAGFNSLVSSTWNPWVFTIDAGGEMGWEVIYNEASGGTAIHLAQDLDSNILACGQLRTSLFSGSSFLMKIEYSGVVPAFLDAFTLQAEGSAVSLVFKTNENTPASNFELLGSNGSTDWLVGLNLDGNLFSALDQNSNLQDGGTITYRLFYLSNGDRTLLHSDEIQVAPSVLATKIVNAYPNPFNPRTKINFSLNHGQMLKLSILDVRGRHVATLLNEIYGPGEYSVDWNGMNDQGRAMPSGAYFAIMGSDNGKSMQRLTLIR